MGKKLKMQRRGKGSNVFRKPPNRYKADVEFGMPVLSGKLYAEVIEFIDDPGHSSPLMLVKYDDMKEEIFIAPEGIKVGDRIQIGPEAAIGIGNVMPVSRIPEGLPVYNIERTPGDGGKLVRSAGSFGTIISHTEKITSVMLPSKKSVELSNNCRAEIGIAAGGGMEMQPIMKAGKNHYIKHATNAKWPVNRGVKSNPVDHPFGGKQHHKGASSMTSRNAPPGAKVGHIAASRVGRRKR
ncbi:MAG: 50S ribosomal protein L2 [Candidatus Micrarchaeota archaeon]|nr:50S ribosomal protein L2 [Candidatus Micrarchaeota archaeon]MDE1847667.1 50S ribosomal protein L2 [Candidatus Micrarchaeota archaeon]MDE1864488.1 50S ribosomal protein L2 [Candidatus Micrarchaeota archaeon]